MRIRRTPLAAFAVAAGSLCAFVPTAAHAVTGESVHDALQGVTYSMPPVETATVEGLPAATEWRTDDPDVTDYLIIGASMTTVLVSDWGKAAYDLMASRHEFFLDARGCRTLTGLRARAGTFDKGLVILVGANDPNLGEYGMDASITTILAEAKRQGIRWVVWFTYNENSSVGPRMARHNAVLWARAADEPRLVIGDWNARVRTLPASWLFGDGIHLGGNAALELADLIADTLDLIDASGPGPTLCTLLRSPTDAPGAGLAAGTGAVEAPADRMFGTVRAARLQKSCVS
jgi:hypothetical protein